jgi:16S rRNA (cytosine967-C5)-methyltransferase
VPATNSQTRVSPARACALRVIRRTFEEDAYADRAFAAEASSLQARDRALAMALSYGAIQRRGTLDHVATQMAERPLGRLDPPVLAVIRLGLFELLYLGGAAEHAAVNESVELVKSVRPHAAGLVNAVLRRAAREGPGSLAGLDDDSPEHAAVLHSVPVWLAGQWWDELGAGDARALLRAINEPAESVLRVNTLVASPAAVAARLPVSSRPAERPLGLSAPGEGLLPEGLVLDGPFDVESSDLWVTGQVQPQSRASMLVARIVDPQPGEHVLDLCAAPGGKTTHLAALMGDGGKIVAVERHPGRAAALERNCARMHASSVRVEVGDAVVPRTDGPFDRILVDAPCSGLGTLQARPDLRWRRQREAIAELAELQGRILAAAARSLAPGGTLVYSVCTISRAEGDDVVESFLRKHRDYSLRQRVQLLQHRDGTDGFFVARLRRALAG